MRTRIFFFHLIAIILAAALAAGCVSTRSEKRSQNIRVITTPPGARVWVADESGQKVIGNSPASLTRNYEVETKSFNSWWWSAVAGSALAVVGGSYLMSEAFGPEEGGYDWPNTTNKIGVAIAISAGIGLILSTIYCIRGEIAEGESQVSIPMTIGAELDGYSPGKLDITIPNTQKEFNLLLSKAGTPGKPAQPPTPVVEKTPEGETQIIAVFDIRDASRMLDKDTLVQLTIYLGTVITEFGKYRVVPRDQLRTRLLEEKKGTYKECFDEKCQIELGKAVAAQKTLATTLIRIGKKCAVASNLYDLKSETMMKGASAEMGCETEELLGAMKQIAGQLSK